MTMPDPNNQPAPDLRPGQRIGEYVLDAPLGRGAFGQVWRAKHHVWDDQVVAVKVPNDPRHVRNLETEGAAIRGLEHPHIVRPIGFDPYAPVPYLITEYVEGASLRDVLTEQGKLDVEDAVRIARQVLMALRHAHDAGVVHRDVKPENVLVEAATAGAKLTDFGLGRAAAADLAASIAYSVEAATPQVVGTLDYMAPEVRAGGEAVPASDLYAVGVMLFEMLTGEKPAGTDVPSEVVDGLPAALDEVFRRSYARREKRYATAAEMLDALAGLDAVPASPPPLPPLPRSRPSLGSVAPPGDCPKCRREVRGDDQFCMHCGQQLVAEVRRCGKCGAYPAAADTFCMFCGTDLRRTVAVG